MNNDFNFEIFETQPVSDDEKKIADNQKKEKHIKRKKKNLAIKIISSAAAAIIILILAFVCYMFTAPSHNPEKLVKSYITSMEKAEWQKAYSMISFENSTTIDEEQFINFCTENPDAIAFTNTKIIDFEIEKDKVSEDKNTIYYSVNYVSQDKSSGTFYLTVLKSRKPKKLSSYSILPSQSCFSSLTITAPSKTEIFINGKALKNPVINNGNLTYIVKYLFAQDTAVTAKNEFCREFETTAKLQPGSNSLNICPEITEECFNKLISLTKEYITSFYTAVINNSEDFSSFPLDSSYLENGFKQDIDEIKSDVFFGNYTISDFKVTDATPKRAFADYKTVLNGNSKNEIEIKYDFKYSYVYTYNDEAGNPVSVNKTDSGYFGVKYILNENWYINDISSKAWF